ncbi:hypothetical protein ABKN59_009634 [Abortiporus biennis]
MQTRISMEWKTLLLTTRMVELDARTIGRTHLLLQLALTAVRRSTGIIYLSSNTLSCLLVSFLMSMILLFFIWNGHCHTPPLCCFGHVAFPVIVSCDQGGLRSFFYPRQVSTSFLKLHVKIQINIASFGRGSDEYYI